LCCNNKYMPEEFKSSFAPSSRNFDVAELEIRTPKVGILRRRLAEIAADSPPMQKDLLPRLAALAGREINITELADQILMAYEEFADSDERSASMGRVLLVASHVQISRVFAPNEPQTSQLLNAIKQAAEDSLLIEVEPRPHSKKKKKRGTIRRSGGSIPSSFELSKRAAEAKKKQQGQ
jgi:hypothetical protein